jgi:hypothetical protein
MSLNAVERARTAAELSANFIASRLTVIDVCRDLDFTAKRLNDTMTISASSSPADVWFLRDYLEQTILDAGATPTLFSVLTPQSRTAASESFELRVPPRHDASVGR